MTGKGWRIPVLERGVPSPWDVGPPDSVCFLPPKQAVALSKPTFGSILYKFIVLGPIIGTVCEKVVCAMMSARAC